MKPTSKRTVYGFLGVGALFLIPALFSAQAILGTHAGFGLMSLVPKPNGVATLVVMSICGALIAAMPFGLLFGIAMPGHSTRQRLLFAAGPALLLLAFSVWINPDSEFFPHWFVRIMDIACFVSLFFVFAMWGARIGGASQAPVRLWPAAGFALLALAYYFSPQVYYSYIYAV
jgi:hypothetical protein